MRVEKQVLFWLGATVVLILVVAVLRDILLPFIAGIAIAYFLSPLVDRLVSLGLNRTLASALIVTLGAVLIITAIVLLTPLLADQAQQLATSLPETLDRLRVAADGWARDRLGPGFPGVSSALERASQSLSENWAGVAGWLASSLWSGSRALFNFISLLLVTPLVAFYLLVDWHPMLEKIDHWLPRDNADSIRRLAGDMNDAVAAFVRGQGTVCLILGIFYATMLGTLGLNYGLLIGLATGVMAFVPFVGWALGCLVATTVAVVQFWPDIVQVLMVFGVFLAGQALDAGFLSPKIVGKKIGLHPVWLIFALIVFSYLLGFIGVLIAVPLAAAMGVLIRFCLMSYLKSEVYRGQGHAAPDSPVSAKAPPA
jgi:predicted PurR-regulated permease PerM